MKRRWSNSSEFCRSLSFLNNTFEEKIIRGKNHDRYLYVPDCTTLFNNDSAFNTMCMSRLSVRVSKNSRMLRPKSAAISSSSDSAGQVLVNIVRPRIASFCINECCARSIFTRCCTAPYLMTDRAICLSLKGACKLTRLRH